MERDLQKILETLKDHEASTEFLTQVLIVLLTNQIESLETSKKALVTIEQNIKDERTLAQDQIEIIRNFVVEIAERLTVLENKS